MKNIRKILVLFFLSFLAVSCFRIEEYPPEPQIKIISFDHISDTTDALGNPVLLGTLRFSFVDGDGDIGFDTLSPLKKTVFLEKYKYVDGLVKPVDLEVPMTYYVPFFKTEEPNKALKGEIIINDINETAPFNGDTIFYKFYIVDRAGNPSNIETTNNLILKYD